MHLNKRKSLVITTVLLLLLMLVPVSAFAANEWQINTSYQVGDQVTYSGKLYQCIQAHTSLAGWEPPNVPALWKYVSDDQNDTEPPTAPTNLTSPSQSSSSITLSWSAAQDNVRVAAYDIYRGSDKVGSATGTVYTDSGLKPDTSYIYYVQARDAAGNVSEASNSITVKTKEATTPGPSPLPDKNLFVGYYESWNEPWDIGDDPTKAPLANLPSSYNVVMLAFVKPDIQYSGNHNLQGTGLEFSYGGEMLYKVIQVLKQRNPETKVIASVGGATYWNWDKVNFKDLKRFVDDFGLDGIDLDYEPNRSFGCKQNNGKVSCETDAEYVSLIKGARAEFPKGKYILAVTPWGVGAFGEDKWVNDFKFESSGSFINPMKQAGDQVDLVNPMGYNAGVDFDPKSAADAFKHYFQGKVAMGAMVPPEDWGGHVWTPEKARDVAKYMSDQKYGGMMLWSIHRDRNKALTNAIAQGLGL
ncbi:carbohydrate-binding protein [Thermoflavimicrobium daqui]|uniref:chitinase n=1 Tax=Thermoflavimicrobium daqui TaxID=2137476 RepID=A0A364K7G0_9BACL|nr:carbohydrate-binding protein [Thermoflavimicrobium daqui]RAL26162.1 hypothetical protein DL897_03955 [Thermoflavimicrobium daqui]